MPSSRIQLVVMESPALLKQDFFSMLKYGRYGCGVLLKLSDTIIQSSLGIKENCMQGQHSIRL